MLILYYDKMINEELEIGRRFRGGIRHIKHVEIYITHSPVRQSERIKAYVVEVRQGTRGPQIVVSRTHPGLLKRLFELEVPEIYEGIVEIKAIAREAGGRSKFAVASRDKNVDAVGACVGPKGTRVQAIVDELKGDPEAHAEFGQGLFFHVGGIGEDGSDLRCRRDQISRLPPDDGEIVLLPDVHVIGLE